MDEINWFIDYYSDIFFQTLNACLAVVYLENVEAYENDTAPEVEQMQQTELREREGEQASYPRRNKDGSKKTYQDFNNEILAFCY